MATLKCSSTLLARLTAIPTPPGIATGTATPARFMVVMQDCDAGSEEKWSLLYRHFTISIIANRTNWKLNLVFMKATILNTKWADSNPQE